VFVVHTPPPTEPVSGDIKASVRVQLLLLPQRPSPLFGTIAAPHVIAVNSQTIAQLTSGDDSVVPIPNAAPIASGTPMQPHSRLAHMYKN